MILIIKASTNNKISYFFLALSICLLTLFFFQLRLNFYISLCYIISIILLSLYKFKLINKKNIIFLNLFLFFLTVFSPFVLYNKYFVKFAQKTLIITSEVITPGYSKKCNIAQKAKNLSDYYYIKNINYSPKYEWYQRLMGGDKKYLNYRSEYKKKYLDYINAEFLNKVDHEKLKLSTDKCQKSFLSNSYVGYLRRFDQVNEIKNNFNLRNLLIGQKYKQIKIDMQNNLFTHNSYLNIIYKNGIFVYFIIIILIFYIVYKERNNFNLIFFMIFLLSQNFDDYLFGNRIETTLLFWFLFSTIIKKHE